MATAREKALEFLKNQGYSEGQIKDATQKVQNQLNSGQSASSVMNDVKSNTSSYFGGSAMYGSSSSNGSSSSSSSSSSSNTNASDVYGDVGGNRSNATPMDFSKTSGATPTDLAFGKNAYTKQDKDSNYLSNRNTSIASYLYNMNKGANVDRQKVAEYLNQFSDFTSNEISQKERDNTIDAILARYGEVKKERENADSGVTGIGEGSINETGGAYATKNGMYHDAKGNYFKILGYDDLSPEQQRLVDQMPEDEKKRLSNEWAKGMQDKVKYKLDREIEKQDAADIQEMKKALHNNDMSQFKIQTEQTIRNAEENYNNLKQNWQYLGNMGMPGTSATKIQAIGDCITEAKTQLKELNNLLDLQKEAKEMGWDMQVLQYTQQIDNINRDLVWKLGSELNGLLSQYTVAELEGKLDTIDGITAFKRELLEELDSNLSGITSESLIQMQYINQYFQDIADKAYEYKQNSNIVNPEMSSVKGFYVDGNGNPILDSKGEIIQVPQSAPMEPVFDKETGKLITFAYDDKGQIVASVQQLWDSSTVSPQGTIAQLLQQGYSVADIMDAVPGADADVVTKVAKAMGVEIEGGKIKGMNTESEDWATLGSDWKTNQVKLGENAEATGIKNVYGTDVKLAPTVGAMVKQAYDYLKEQGIDLQIGDSYRSYATQKSAYEKDQALPADQRKGVAAPGKSFHEIGQAIDVAQSQMNDPKVLEALYSAGLTRPVASEPWHWSYGEGPDAFGYATKKQTPGYDNSLKGYYENWFKLTKDDRANALKEYGLTLKQFNDQRNAYFDELEKTEAVESITALRNKAQELLDWNKKHQGRHSGSWDKQTYKNGGYKFLGYEGQTDASEGIAMYNWLKNNQTLDKFVEAKKDGGTFGSMSEGEWKILGGAASQLDWEQKDKVFENQLQSIIDEYNEKLAKIQGITVDEVKKEKGTKRTKQGGGNLTN